LNNWEQLGTHPVLSVLRREKDRKGEEGVQAFLNFLSPPSIAKLILLLQPCSRTCKQAGFTMSLAKLSKENHWVVGLLGGGGVVLKIN